ncbi:TetR/AcrR family transcriptional regulator [Deinococcus hopiensis]|uniref:Transcriptional regulator, TetR family n=1 Tax=Deinococcus hopiensis KR-140 TaxID=695939 RepID=A0A1W1VN71_9DEIO|nr:TetR/AcrR family transcriptional regulator [Deinococcus hopiensis]SMB94778.1 transcriptional regulator, TetR family [Deinococcus hopiensis KR-140]
MVYPSKLSPEAILQAAERLLRGGGEEGLSMRALAEALGVRASSLYRHYPDRAALLLALEDGAVLALHREMAAAAEGLFPGEAVLAAGHAYLNYARAQPHLYGLLLAHRPPAVAGPGAGKALWNHVLHLVGAVTGHPDDTAAAVAFWAYLHGFALLERSGQFGLSGPRGGFERGLEALVRGLATEQKGGG